MRAYGDLGPSVRRGPWHHAGMRAPIATVLALAAFAPAAAHAGVPPENARAFAQEVYSRYVADRAVPTGWPGPAGTCDVALDSPESGAATLGTLNALRALARVPPVTFSWRESMVAADAATLMAANKGATHTPPPDWACWTSTGADAAAASNLALGPTGARAIAAYLDDPGDNNAVVGHRMNVLDPRPRVMGSASTDITNALTSAYLPARFAPQNTMVAWPPPGWFPAQLMTRRWSLAIHGSSDITRARVAMTLDGSPIAVSGPIEGASVDRFEHSLVWEPDPAALDRAADGGDHQLGVVITGIRVSGLRASARYTVRTFGAAEVPGTYVPPEGLSNLSVSRRGRVVTVRATTARAGTVTADVSHDGYPIEDVKKKVGPGRFTIRVPLKGVSSTGPANIQAAVVLTSPDGLWDTLLSKPRRF